MKLRRLAFVPALLAAAFPASAQVRAAAAPAPLSAPSARALPLSYALILDAPAPALSAGSAFLADAAAQAWFAANRPEQVPALTRGALDLRDWEQVLNSFDDPRLLREAVLSRQESPVATKPAVLLALVDRTPSLAAKRGIFEEAVIDWSIFSTAERAALAASGAPENAWSGLSLPERYETTRRVLQESAGTMITVGPEDPEFPAQFEKALARAGRFMTDEELEAARASAARTKRARASAERTVAALTGAPRAAEELGALEPAYDLSPDESRALLARLETAVLGLVRGTPSGDALLAAVSGGRPSLAIGAMDHVGALASYHAESSSIVLGGKPLAGILAALGRAPRDLLTDDEALADAAVIYSHLFVHETTHHLQEMWASRLPPEARPLVYSHQSEVEANNAQAKFLKEKRAADPAFAARDARLRDVRGIVAAVMRQPEALASDPAAMSSWLALGYHRVPTLARARARLIGFGLDADRRDADDARRVDAALARLRRLPAAQRRDLAGTTGELRRLRDSLRGHAQAMVRASQALADRVRAELAKLE